MLQKHAAVALTLAAMLCMAGTASAASRPAVMASPSPSAAMVIGMPGMVNGVKLKTISGVVKTQWDGVVLRKTRVTSKGVVIPPSGAYITIRSGNWKPFDNEPITLGGKPFYYINQRSVRDVLHDVTFTPGETKAMNHKSRGWQLTQVEKDPFFMEGGYVATFKLVKATGNYYGEAFPVMAGPRVNNDGSNGVAAAKNYEEAGVSERKGRLDDFIMGKNVSADGRTYVVVDSVTPDEVKVREMGTDSITDAWISASAPMMASCRAGDKFVVGDAEVQVTMISNDAATILISEGGKTVEKTFGPWNADTRSKLFLSETVRDSFWTLSPSGKQIVHLNVNGKESPLGNGKVSLVAYKDVIDIQDGSLWPYDPRFIARPET